MSKPSDFYLPKKEAVITANRFRSLFFGDIWLDDSFRITAKQSNIRQVVWEKGKNMPSHYGLTSFYKQGLDKGGCTCMQLVFRTKNYNELVDYLFKIGEEWRLEWKIEQL